MKIKIQDNTETDFYQIVNNVKEGDICNVQDQDISTGQVAEDMEQSK